jgi:hypothetical protein
MWNAGWLVSWRHQVSEVGLLPYSHQSQPSNTSSGVCLIQALSVCIIYYGVAESYVLEIPQTKGERGTRNKGIFWEAIA